MAAKVIMKGTTQIDTSRFNNLRVEMLDLQGNDIGHKGTSMVMEMLLENVTICHLNLANNNLGNFGAREIGNTLPRLKLVKYLNLAGNKFGDSGMETMALGIALNMSIELLNLSYNEFEERGGKLLGGALAMNKKLRHLDLSWNHLRGNGGVAVVRALKTNATLTSLNLSMNGLGYEGSVAVSEALRHNSTLTELDVRNNRINWDGARIISRALRNNITLRVLKIGENPLTTTGCHDLVDSVTGDKSNLKLMDCSNVCVLGETLILAASIRAKRKFQFLSGRKVGSPDKLGQRSAREKRPMEQMLDFIKKHGLRPLELLKNFDKTATCEMPRSEFINRIKKTGIRMYNFEIEALADEITTKSSVDGIINYRSLIESVLKEVKLERDNKVKERDRKQRLKEYHKRILQRGTPEDLQDSNIHLESFQDPAAGCISFCSRETSDQRSRLFTITHSIRQLSLVDSRFKQENTGTKGITGSNILPKPAVLPAPVRFLSMTAPLGRARTSRPKAKKKKKKVKRVK
ncbi:hypothetical protein CHS0354_025250 [Potamilus streckersoni]|uniref:Leucine-rich repeat-containing protein 74A n=1 Tax=Potamilus streckersoni TaxID=2493646 RepID=A0AAE0RS68_9BIVA|nr:hypothetical protein CHS0354_025250 [Potamilus streckersoni]